MFPPPIFNQTSLSTPLSPKMASTSTHLACTLHSYSHPVPRLQLSDFTCHPVPVCTSKGWILSKLLSVLFISWWNFLSTFHTLFVNVCAMLLAQEVWIKLATIGIWQHSHSRLKWSETELFVKTGDLDQGHHDDISPRFSCCVFVLVCILKSRS